MFCHLISENAQTLGILTHTDASILQKGLHMYLGVMRA
jgi:hypothetical protein